MLNNGGVMSKGFRRHYFREGLTEKQCSNIIKSAFGNETPIEARIYNWFKKFSHFCKKFSDDVRDDQPKISRKNGKFPAMIPGKIHSPRKLIVFDRHLAYDKIQASLNISKTRMHSI